ncbi:MAG: type II secretion system F family protein [Candidatus Paceibacterota bacterium]
MIKNIFQKRKWKRRELILFLERLELYISSGLPLDMCLQISSDGVTKRQKKIVLDIRSAVLLGSQLSKAMVVNMNLSNTIAGLIRHGETSGQLGKALVYAKELLEREEDLIKKCISALIYPTVIGIFAIILTFALVKGVMPQIIPMLRSLNVQLLLITRIIMFISENLMKYSIHLIVFGILSTVGLLILYKKVETFRNKCQSFISRLPIIGRLINLYYISLFTQSLGSLIESGTSLTIAYSNTVSSLSFAPIKLLCKKQEDNVKNGYSLGLVFAKIHRLPPYIAPLISAGEMAGTLGNSLIRTAKIADSDLEYSLKKITSLIEPVMMAGMGLVVGAIALSIVLPIYDVSKVLQQ